MTGDELYRLPLRSDELWDALTKGLGRAVLHVREHGDAEGVLPKACREDLRYDVYEDLRVGWLIELMDAAGAAEPCRLAVVDAVSRLEDDGYYNHDAKQLCGLAEHFARSGDAAARQALDEVFERFGFGSEAIVRLDGEAGYRRVLQSLAKFEFDNESPVRVASEVLGTEQARALLEEEARTNVGAANALEGERAWDRGPRPRRRATLDEVLEAVERGDVSHFNWADEASDGEVELLYQRFLVEDRPTQLLCYLKVFARKRMPELSDRLVESVRSEERRLRHAARMALADWELDEEERLRVRQLAWELLETEGLTSERRWALPLLRRTFLPEDAPRIHALLADVDDRESINDAASDLLSIANSRWAPELVPLLLWVYEQSHCTWPRKTATGLLIEHGALPSEVREECRFDCLAETRALVG